MLERLQIDVLVDFTTTVVLVEWLGCGTLPRLKMLMLGRPPHSETVMADAMLEARAALPNCQRLEVLGGQGWLDNGSEEIRLSLLRAALRSVDIISSFEWRARSGRDLCAGI